jgi:hypothetical protein
MGHPWVARFSETLTCEQRARFMDAALAIWDLAAHDAAQRCMEAICPLCDIVHKNQVEAASQMGDGITFWHTVRVGGVQHRKCLADPIRQLPWVKVNP